MEEIKLSVIVPMFNSEFTIEPCLKSIFRYPTKNMEIILINDGSFDKTLEVCKKFIAQYNNINLFSYEENKGVGYARNIGLENSKGKYIAFIDSDDYIENDMLNKLLNISESTDVDIVMGNINEINLDEINKKITNFDQSFYNRILLDVNDIASTNHGLLFGKIYKKSLFTDNNINFNVNLSEDGIANLQMFNSIKSIYILDEDIYVHRLSTDSICTQKLNANVISEITETLNYVNNNINNIDYIKSFNYHFIDQFIIKFILEYQSPILYSKIYDEVFEKNKRFILFGVSRLGKEYLSLLERNGYKNIILVDNDINKHNTYIHNHKILSVDELKQIKNSTDILIISSQYFVFILKQLIDNKIINNISEVLISKNNTKIKNALLDLFEFTLTLNNYFD